MGSHTLLVTAEADADRRATIEAKLPDAVDSAYLDDVEPADRPDAVESADALLSMAPHVELDEAAFGRLHAGQVLQTISAGVDFLPFERFPEGLTIQSNAGAYAEPMAEHVLAMYLALSKRLLIEHRKMESGEFDQFEPNRQVAESTCAIFGYGATGEATARLMAPLGVDVLAINRSGESGAADLVDFLGTPDDLEYVLGECDGLVIAAPLTPETRGLFDRDTLDQMADDDMLINVARGELIDQEALYEHLTENPAFQAGLEAWWTEPIRHGEFSLEYPLLDLPNVLACPHNSAQVPGIHEEGLRRAVRNVAATLGSEEHANVVDPKRGY